MTIGQKIINKITLSIGEAHVVSTEHYQVLTGCSVIQLAGWKAVAKTYKLESLRFCERKGLDGSTAEINDEEELPDYGMGQEASYYEDMRRKNESHGKE